jgi:uncharacterized repeat protein (TIGR03917 family)
MAVTVLDCEVYSMGEAARLLAVRTQKLRGWIDGYSRGATEYGGSSSVTLTAGATLADLRAALRGIPADATLNDVRLFGVELTDLADVELTFALVVAR